LLIIVAALASFETRQEHFARLFTRPGLLMTLCAVERFVAVVAEDAVLIPGLVHAQQPQRLINGQAVGPLGRIGLLLMAFLAAAAVEQDVLDLSELLTDPGEFARRHRLDADPSQQGSRRFLSLWPAEKLLVLGTENEVRQALAERGAHRLGRFAGGRMRGRTLRFQRAECSDTLKTCRHILLVPLTHEAAAAPAFPERS
jgi:hypothetical protein